MAPTLTPTAEAQLPDLHERYFQTREPALRDELIRRYERLPYSMVARLSDRAGDPEDLQQTAMIGLLKALERFEPDRGVAFTTYAWATISGELKRYFRDSTWGMRVPRHLQERYLEVSRVLDDLSNELHRSPTLHEVAAAAGITIDEVAEAIELQHARRVSSIDAPTREDGPSLDVPVEMGEVGQADDRDVVHRMLRRLPEREQRIVWLRFGCEMSQSEIATRVGISQMQVSRLLSRSLTRLREWADDVDDSAEAC
ncbi:MAG: polymerase sigma-B factor [Acidimicrobiaceae bacterium]|nr:polymerase sigma-B factor [Acidimicrobiaceae bacterium]